VCRSQRDERKERFFIKKETTSGLDLLFFLEYVFELDEETSKETRNSSLELTNVLNRNAFAFSLLLMLCGYAMESKFSARWSVLNLY